MRQMQPVLWTKGVLLSPQHFQTQDHYLEDQLRFRISTLHRFAWGVRELTLDRDALPNGILALKRAAAIFPDGLLYDAPGEDALPAERPLAGLWKRDQRALDVFLAIPRSRPDGGNVHLAFRPNDVRRSTSDNAADAPPPTANGQGTRYVGESVPRRDSTTGLSERPVQLARKNVRLLVEGEPLEGHTTLRIGRVRRDREGHFALDPHVVAPLIDVAASEVVLALVRGLVELLAAKSFTLSSGRRQLNRGLATFGATDVAQFWFLYTVNTFLPQLRHLAEIRRGHPETLYATMLGLAGALTTFLPGGGTPLPPYDHDDVGGCFGALDARLRGLLETALPEHAVSLPMRADRPSVFTTRLDDERYLRASQMYLAVAADVERGELVARVSQLVKISSAEHLEPLIRRGLAGVTLTHTATLPGAVAVRSEYEYFSLALRGAAWDEIRQVRSLAAYVPDDLPGARLELIVVLGDEP